MVAVSCAVAKRWTGETRFVVLFGNRLGECTETAVTWACTRKLHEANRIITRNRFVKWELDNFEYGQGKIRTQNFGNVASRCTLPCSNASRGPNRVDAHFSGIYWNVA